MSRIETLENNIVSRLTSSLTYLQTVRGVSDIATYLDLDTVAPQGAIVVFDGEKADSRNLNIGGALQQTSFYWSVFAVAQNFSGTGDGRNGSNGAYQIIDDVIAALEGHDISGDGLTNKLFYVESNRVGATQTNNAIVYVVRFRCQSIRQAA